MKALTQCVLRFAPTVFIEIKLKPFWAVNITASKHYLLAENT